MRLESFAQTLPSWLCSEPDWLPAGVALLAVVTALAVALLPTGRHLLPALTRLLHRVYLILTRYVPALPRGHSGKAPELMVHLVFALILSTALLLAFGAIAHELRAGQRLPALDQLLADCMQRNSGRRELAMWRVVTLIGSAPSVVLIGAAGAVILWRRGSGLVAAAWIATIAGGAILNLLLKNLFERPRPAYAEPALWRATWSFPSGHAMQSLIVFGLIAYLGWPLATTRLAHVAITVATVLLVTAIGMSRLVLGVHYLSDIVAGYTVGAVWLAFALGSVAFVQHRQRPA